jgi:hypothetical protein
MAQLLAGFEPVIADLTAGAAEYFGDPRATIEPVRRVDGPYSSVLRVRVSSREGTIYAYVKVLKPRDASAEALARVQRFLEREHRSTAAFHRHVQRGDEIGAVRPIACLPHHNAIVTEEVPGEPFGGLVERATAPSPALLAIAERVGRWVRLYQEASPTDALVVIAERRAYVDDRLRALTGSILSEDVRSAVLAEFDAIAGEIGQATVPAVAIHADLSPENVLVGADGRVTVLDFTMAKTGSRAHDLSHLYFHFALRAARRRGRADLYRGVQSRILSGYDPGLTAADPIFRLSLWQHAVCDVAILAERRVPVGAAAYRWFIRRRWRRCAEIAAGTMADRHAVAATPAGA